MRQPRSETERKERLGSVIQRELARAEGGNSDQAQANRTEALRYYYALPRGDEQENRSQVISTDVADMTNAVLAMLVPMISTDAVVQFEPMGEEDESAAQMESHVVNGVVIEDSNGFIEIQEAVKDSLLLRNGVLKVMVDEQTSVEKMDVTGAPDEALALMALEAPPGTEISRDGDTLTVATTKVDFVVSAVPTENISYQSGYTGPLQGIRFFAERVQYTRSELIERGVSKTVVEDLQPHDDYDNSASDVRRGRATGDDDAETRDQDQIDCHEAYLLIDLDGDGISERYHCLVAEGKTCLQYEAQDLIPYALGSPFLSAHRITGESLFDHIKPTQDTKTALRRQFLDNIATVNNGRYVYDPSRVAEDDILNPTAGGGIRARDTTAVMPLATPDMTPGILAALQYEDQVRSERGGASLDLTAADAQLVGETAHGIERQYGSREAMASMMGKNLAETLIRGIYRLTHEYMRRYANRPYPVRINGQYAQVDPRQWPERTRLNVTTGMTPGQRGHLQQTLMASLQLQAQAMQSGLNGVLASPETLYRTHQAWLRLAGVDNPERLGIDPASPAAQEALQAAQQAAQQQQQREETMLRLQVQLEQAKLAEDARQADAKVQHDYYATDMQAEIAEAKIAGQGVIDLEKQRMANDRPRQGIAGGGAAGAGGDS